MPLVSSEANLAFSPISSSLTTIAYDGTRYENYEGTISEIDLTVTVESPGLASPIFNFLTAVKVFLIY